MEYCPVCRTGVDNLDQHLEQHTKNEIITVLLGNNKQVNGRPDQERLPGLGSSSTSTDPGTSSTEAQVRDVPGPSSEIQNTKEPSRSAEDVSVTLARHGSWVDSRQTVANVRAVQSSSAAGDPIQQPPINIQRALNNVSIVNNITNSQIISTPTTNGGATSEAGKSGVPQPSLVVPSVVGNLVMCGGVMPVNFGMSTPLLLPQMNGPTLLLNVPNYIPYQGVPPGISPVQGMFMPNLYDPAGASVPATHHYLIPSTAPLTTATTTSAAVSSSLVTPTPSASLTPVTTVKSDLEPVDDRMEVDYSQHDEDRCEEEDNGQASPNPLRDQADVKPSSATPPPPTLNPERSTPGPSTSQPTPPRVSPTVGQETSIQQRVISHLDSSRVIRISNNFPVREPTGGRPDSGPRDQQKQQHDSSSTASAVVETASIDGSIRAAAQCVPTPPVSTCSSNPSQSPAVTTTRGNTSSVIVSLNSMSQASETVSNNNSNNNNTASVVNPSPVTIHTVEALQSALACDNDVQLVIANDLLETPEFRALMQNMEHSSITTPASDKGSSLDLSGYDDREHSAPAAVRPAEDKPVFVVGDVRVEPGSQQISIVEQQRDMRYSSPEPGSSRDISREATWDGFENPDKILSLPYASDVDLTLQDLIAVETIDESQMPEDDMTWTGPISSLNYLNNFMSLGKDHRSFHCVDCGENFGSASECREHSAKCGETLTKKGKKSKPAVTDGQQKKVISSLNDRPTTDVSSTVTRSEIVCSAVKFEGTANKVGVKNETEEESMSELFNKYVKTEELATDNFDEDIRSPEIIQLNATENVKSEITVASQDPLAFSGNHWKCAQCRKVFDSGPELLNHLEEFRAGKIKCHCCHLIFQERRDLLEHGRLHHGTEDQKKVKEEVCTESKPFKVNALGEFTCDICDRAFKEKDRMLKHLTCHFEDKPFECLDCGKRFSKVHLMKEHKKRHTMEKKFRCPHCTKSFLSGNKLREHIRVHTGETPLKCNICGKCFKRHSNLSGHKRTHDPNREPKPPKELFCHGCGKQFSTQRDLDWHVEEVHERVPKRCKYCGDIFVHSTSLTRHIRSKHESSFLPKDKKASNYANCPICDLVFYKTSIRKHISVVHQGEKRFTCEICKSMFVSKFNLDNHMWQHKSKRFRPFKCSQCKKAYVRESLLKEHMKTHQGRKPYVCNECGVQFTMKNNYKRHVEEHNGLKNYACTECDKTFTRAYYLSDHMKTHSGEKPYICGICGKTTATRSNYNSHLKTHVTREPVNSEV